LPVETVIEGNAARTIAFWFKGSPQNAWRYLFSFGAENNRNAFSGRICENGRLGFMAHGFDEVRCTGPQLDDGRWHFVSLSYDTQRLIAYVDGETPIWTTDIDGGLNTLPTVARIGNHVGNSPVELAGQIDEFRIFDRALTPDEIQAVHDADRNQMPPNALLARDGLSAQTAAVDCSRLLTDHPQTESGVYWLDPDGADGEVVPVEVYCDMTTDGGGWAIIFRQEVPNMNSTEIDYTVNAAWLRSTDHQVLIAHRFVGQEVRGSYATFGMPQDWVNQSPYRFEQSTVMVEGKVDVGVVGDIRLAYGRDSWSENECIINDGFGSNGNPHGPAGKICLNVEGAPGHTHWARDRIDGCGSSPATMGINDNPPCQGWGFTIGTRPPSP